MENDKILTIAIPTYNRIEALKKTLYQLIPQLDSTCFLLILDNHSDKIVSDEIEAIIGNLPKESYSIIRNRVNVGGDPNIFRCFEFCETQWLWTLSDDDEILPNALEVIKQTINEYNDALFVNFYSAHELHPIRKQTEKFYGTNGLIESVDSFGAAIFISTNLYNMSQIHSFNEANRMVYSCASQWAILFFNVTDKKYVVRSNKEIVRNTFTSSNYSAFNLTVISGFMTFLNIRTNQNVRKALTKMILSVDKGWISYQSLIKLLFFEYAYSNGKKEIRYHLSRYFWGLYRFGSFKNSILYVLFFLLSFFPAFTCKCIKKIVLFKNQK